MRGLNNPNFGFAHAKGWKIKRAKRKEMDQHNTADPSYYPIPLSCHQVVIYVYSPGAFPNSSCSLLLFLPAAIPDVSRK